MLIIANKKKLEFTYCYIRYVVLVIFRLVRNTFNEIVFLVGYPFVALSVQFSQNDMVTPYIGFLIKLFTNGTTYF